MNYGPPTGSDELRLEVVICSVGFDDMLDVTLGLNHGHFDTAIIVTAHSDHRTKAVGKKHSAIVVETDLFKKNGRNFNKGAAINAGMNYWQYFGWRMHLDADIVLPDSFRRVLFNHSYLDKDAIYGADRVDVVGVDALHRSRKHPQHEHGVFVSAKGQTGHRYIDSLDGWLPLGYFQLWNARCQKPYAFSLGSAARDDIMFSATWPASHRRLLPGVVVSHLCSTPPVLGQNWDGHRRMPRLK